MIEDIMREWLEIHDASCDIRQSRELVLEECESTLIELHDTILERLDIAPDCCDRRTYLMWEIREEVGTDFFLDRESFMEIIYRGDERSEFIISPISYRSVSFTIDDVLYGRGDRTYRTKYRTYPEKISE